MPLEAMYRSDSGQAHVPTTEAEWAQWISATTTRNYVIDDPILDWLELYGPAHGFLPDNEIAGYDSRTDFTAFLFQQGERFEAAVTGHFRSLADVVSTGEDSRVRDPALAAATFEAMSNGVPIIDHGTLWDAKHRIYGIPDLLVRSDVLAELFPGCVSVEEATVSAPDLGDNPWHYRVVDIKFTTLRLLSSGRLGNSASSRAYKAQLFLYNRALGRVQGYTPTDSYLLGRGWRRTIARENRRGTSCMDLVAPVGQEEQITKGLSLGEMVESACGWVRRVQREGATWSPVPQPEVEELHPNMGNQEDGPWHHAKTVIAEEIGELTLLWQVGPEKRKQAGAAGIKDWRDARCTATAVGVTGPKQGPVLQAILDINQVSGGRPVGPDVIRQTSDDWRTADIVDFYVDFETVSDLADDFSKIPERGGQPLIFMIGCGHMQEGRWSFEQFTVDRISEDQEGSIIAAWLAHMGAVRTEVAPGCEEYRILHWSAAETITLEGAYNSAMQRHAAHDWPSLPWFDLLALVVRAEPVVVRGALGFGLKAISTAMHSHGLIETVWEEGPADGLGAMVGGWWCEEEARRRDVPLSDIDLMQEIGRYNEVDCRAMMAIVRYLRSHH